MQRIFKISQKDYKSILLLDNGEVIKLNIKNKLLLNDLCNKFGSSLEGRIKSFKTLTNAKQKPCVMIHDDLIFMPTFSIDNIECEFIQYNRIVWIKDEGNKCLVLFDNGYKLSIDCSYRTMKKQIKRCDLFIKQLLTYRKSTIKEICQGV